MGKRSPKRLFGPSKGDGLAGSRLVNDTMDFFGKSDHVTKALDLDWISSRFGEYRIPVGALPFSRYVSEVLNDVLPHCINTGSKQFIGHMTTALPRFAGAISDVLIRTNQNMVKMETSQGLFHLERQSLGMLHHLAFRGNRAFYEEHLHNPGSTLGVVCSGGTLANLTALWCARNNWMQQASPAGQGGGFNRKGPVIIGSELMHYSLIKSADILGLGPDSCRLIETDFRHRLKPSRLAKELKELGKERRQVLAIIGIAGSTDCGSIDPLDAMADLAEEFGVHYHVDAAWGGPYLFSKKLRRLLKGAERADSMTIDGHKQMFLPNGIGLLLFRDPQCADSIEMSAPYIIRRGSMDQGRRAIDGTRPAMCLHLHAALNVIGSAGYADVLETGRETALFMARLISGSQRFELLDVPQTNIIVYRYIPVAMRSIKTARRLSKSEESEIDRFNTLLQETQFSHGESFVSRTTLLSGSGGRRVRIVCLRAVVANPLLTKSDIKRFLASQARLAMGIERNRAHVSATVKRTDKPCK
jgi:putative pyridoxal-dependent aspartate 1-decarboxylase